uniref:RING-H2 zinc finger protein RHA1b n=2 Tax=Cajanus cajan TaxID=3821 RepID=A0A151TJV6_CAJCA|nr:RING-H2 zinc finger protein RHA1b [Cajanus cajan]
MGFPVGYTELVLPKVLVQALSVLGFMRKLITLLFCYMGLLQADIAWPQYQYQSILPVLKFSEAEAEESCAVCLFDFQGEEEIRRLPNCRHIFHRGCLDRWMGYHQRTCPLCRTPFIPHPMAMAMQPPSHFYH